MSNAMPSSMTQRDSLKIFLASAVAFAQSKTVAAEPASVDIFKHCRALLDRPRRTGFELHA